MRLMAAEPGPPRESIERHLNKILDSPVFSRAGRQSSLLRFIVENSLDGKEGALREACIGVEVYGRPSDFDPRADTIVRVEASRLRTRLLEYYESSGRDDELRITIPKGGYVPVFASRHTATPAVSRVAVPRKAVLVAISACLALVAGFAGYFYSKARGSADVAARRQRSKKLFQQAMRLHMMGTPASVSEARALHEEVVRQDPGWARAHSGLAHTFLTLIDIGVKGRQEVSDTILTLARKSIQLDPADPDGHSALIRFHRDVKLNWKDAGEACRTALSKAPDLRILANCGLLHSLQGNHEIAKTLVREAIESYPSRRQTWQIACVLQYRAGKYREALSACARLLELDPESIVARNVQASILALEGSLEKAVDAHRSGLPAIGVDREDWISTGGYLAARAGNATEMRRMISRLDQRARSQHRVSPVSYAYIHLGWGEHDKVLDLLEQAAGELDGAAAEFLANPITAPLRASLRFQRVAGSLGLEQQAR